MKPVCSLILFVCILICSPVYAFTLYVMPEGATAPTVSDGVVVNKLQNALNQAAAELAKTGPQKVTVKISGGQYAGAFDAGFVFLPKVVNPQAELVIEGGYDSQFASRAPFKNRTDILTNPKRNSAMFYLEKDSVLKSLNVSGLWLDAAPSNSYDAKSNSLKPGNSPTYRLMEFNYLTTDELIIDSNVFMNSAMKALTTLIRAASDKTTIRLSNNLFIGNRVNGADVATAYGKLMPALCTISNNTFVMNYGMNPERSTSSSGALLLANNYSCGKVEINKNIFANNMLGGIEAKQGKLPPLAITDNIFFNNNIFDAKGPGDTAILASLQNQIVSVDTGSISDLSTVTAATGNLAVDPQLGVGEAMTQTQSAGSDSVQVQNTTENQVRGILGMNKIGSDISIQNFCPKVVLAGVPLPADSKYKSYGVQ